MPSQLIGAKRAGEAAEYAKSWYEFHDIADVEIDRVEYPQSSVAEARGVATIDGTTTNLRLRWVYHDSQGNLALNREEGSWQLAIVRPRTYLVDENGERLT